MSFVSAIFPSDPYSKNWGSEGKGNLAKQLCKAGQLMRDLRIQMRFGELTRAPLKLIRLLVLDDVVECDWLARPPDPWDSDLKRSIQQRHVSIQTLRDAIDVRALVFEVMPKVQTANFRVYREASDYSRETIILACTQRNDHASRDVHSLVMRAKVLGFRFDLEGDTLRKLSAR